VIWNSIHKIKVFVVVCLVWVLIMVYCNFENRRPAKQAPGFTQISRDVVFKMFGNFKQEAGNGHPAHDVAKCPEPHLMCVMLD
jgi:hypothetical protein